MATVLHPYRDDPVTRHLDGSLATVPDEDVAVGNADDLAGSLPAEGAGTLSIHNFVTGVDVDHDDLRRTRTLVGVATARRQSTFRRCSSTTWAASVVPVTTCATSSCRSQATQ
jgi:hypothetical protein